MKLSLYISGILGLAVNAALIGFYGVAAIGAALRGVGWGVLAVILFHFLQLLFSSPGTLPAGLPGNRGRTMTI